MTLVDTTQTPVNLQHRVTAQFQMCDWATGDQKILANATVVQNNADPSTWGQVVYYWQAGDTDTPGVYKGRCLVDFGNGVIAYPQTEELVVLVSSVGGMP
jgi:hypothetical protein